MWRHTESIHNGNIGVGGGVKDYKMEVLDIYKEALTRIIGEAVRIEEQEKNKKVLSLNSKSEYFRSQYICPTFEEGPMRE